MFRTIYTYIHTSKLGHFVGRNAWISNFQSLVNDCKVYTPDAICKVIGVIWPRSAVQKNFQLIVNVKLKDKSWTAVREIEVVRYNYLVLCGVLPVQTPTSLHILLSSYLSILHSIIVKTKSAVCGITTTSELYLYGM